MNYTIHQIASIVEGAFLMHKPDIGGVLNPVGVEAQPTIQHLLLDSRQVIFPATSLFIALQGRRHDGHEFLADLYQNGVRNYLISIQIDPTDFPGANFILVKNTHVAFHRLAFFHRHQFPQLRVIGITGSNGKTIVKEWLFQLLQEDFHIVRSPKSFNSQTGVPLSVLQITPQHDLGIFEAGISQPGEMEKLAPLIDPEIGIFTNLGEAHSEGFPNDETKLMEKLQLFEKAKVVIYCADDERVVRGIEALSAASDGVTSSHPVTLAWSKKELSALEVLTALPFSDTASFENAGHCRALMRHLGYDDETIRQRLAKIEPVAMRLELKEAINQCLLINDSYNSDLTSLTIALNFLQQQSKTPRRTVILSDILQSGQAPAQLYGEVAKLLVEKKIDRLIGIGEQVKTLENLLPAYIEALFFKTTAEFLEALPRLHFSNETILLKGARRFEFERIANRLSAKVHQTALEINLGALLHNLRIYQSCVQPGTKMMAMVKASGYGSGSEEVAKLLEFQHVDYLGVAYADEGVALRKAGIRLPILVMNPEEATFELLVEHRLEPEIYSLALLQKFTRFLRQADAEAVIHLKLDTGMHRLGFEAGDLDELISQLNACPEIKVSTVFSHLAASESPAHDAFTRSQVGRFQQLFERLAAGLGYRPLRHILNSGGIVRFPEFQMDMVRLGIGLYGIDSSGQLQSRLQMVSTLKATISQIKLLPPGETVSYGRSGKVEKPMRIATLSLGYADGLLRAAGNGRYSVLIHGKKAPLFGNVCMDMAMADVTEIPEAKEGDPVVVFGKDLPVQELAKCLGTIPYEIFTTISERVKRVYVQE